MNTVRYRNPVYSEYFADPFVWKAGDEYCAVGTGPDEAAGRRREAQQPTVFPLLRSSDLVNWREAGRALIPPAAALGDAFWAPEVATDGKRWFMYYSVGFNDRLHHLRVAISNSPLGPYTDANALTNVEETSFAIDPHPFQDADGRWYLFYARDFLTTEDERGAEVRVRAAGRRNRHMGRPGLERTQADRLAADVLDLARDERSHVRSHYDRRVLRRGDLGGIGIGPGADEFSARAGAGPQGFQLALPDVVSVRVGQQHRVHVPEPRIVRAGN